jgi:hypothetical protein
MQRIMGLGSSLARRPVGSLVCATLILTAFLAAGQGVGAQTRSRAAPEGPPAYANGFPQDPSFFPIGVWLQSPSRAPAYKAMGINTFVGLWEGPTEEQLSALAGSGMYAVAAQNEVGLTSPHRNVIRAWMHEDEPDNAQKSALGVYVACVPARQIVERTQGMRRKDKTRPIFVNFGRGVADTRWHGRGTCTGDTKYYTAAAKGIDIVSFDIYPVAGSDPPIKGRLETVAQGVANLQSWATDAKSVWAIVETTRIGQETERATTRQIRAEIWLALIQGAKGIGYFVHEFAGGFREDGIFRYPDTVEGVTRINEEIRSLAPVLNSPSLREPVAVSGSGRIATTSKRYQGALYVFAASSDGNPSESRLTIPSAAQGQAQGQAPGQATVIGENRTVSVKDGVIEDLFAGYDVHLYRIDARP